MLFKRASFYIAIVGIIAAISLVARLNSQPPEAKPPVKPAANPFKSTISAAGIVEAKNENVEIGVPVQGLVTEVKVKVWDRVQKGQALFELDNRDLMAQLEVQKANQAVADANLSRLQDQLSRWKAVKDPRAVSVDDVRNREHDVKVAKAQAQMAQAQIRQTQMLLERLVVRAPKDGLILQSNIRPGEYAAYNPQKPAMVLGDLNDMQVRADVDEQNAVRVRPNQAAVAYIKGSKEKPIPLTFLRIEPLVIPKKSLTGAFDERVDTRVLQVIFSVQPGSDHQIYVGQQVDVFISDEAKAEAPVANK